MNRTLKAVVLFLALTLFGEVTVYAGAIIAIKCNLSECGYQKEMFIGQGMLEWSDEIYYVCTNCKEIGEIVVATGKWKFGGKPGNPERGTVIETVSAIGTISNGQEIYNIYACPKCQKPVIGIDAIGDIRHCPKCGKLSIQSEVGGKWD